MSVDKENHQNLVSVTFWRERFHELKAKVEAIKPKVSLQQALIRGNAFYDSAAGTADYFNLIRDKAGIAKTQRAVQALENFLLDNDHVKKGTKHLKNIVLP